MKKYLIIGITLLIGSLFLTINKELKEKNINYINIHDITGSGSKLEGVYVSLDSTFIAGTITGDKNNSFYVIFGDGVQYIVYINNKKAEDIRKFLLDNPEEKYQIFGITKKIPTTLEKNGMKFIHEWLDKNHTHSEKEDSHSHDVTVEDFYQYFGYVYLDNTIYGKITDSIIICIMSVLGVLSLFFYVNNKYHLI